MNGGKFLNFMNAHGDLITPQCRGGKTLDHIRECNP